MSDFWTALKESVILQGLITVGVVGAWLYLLVNRQPVPPDLRDHEREPADRVRQVRRVLRHLRERAPGARHVPRRVRVVAGDELADLDRAVAAREAVGGGVRHGYRPRSSGGRQGCFSTS